MERGELIGYCGFSSLFGTSPKLLLMAAKMHQLASISKGPKINNFLKDPFGLYVCLLQDATNSDPFLLSAE